ncbi:MAG TPA: hypothetical protein ENK37_03955 [Oceanithermus profundus]|uniref:Uncharacterized protein n=1 Tax=Oceanithermus profundus TaxID=187137 RepID=A0A7C4Z8F7_9DEIN|nr:hypothetical protein [Oceanithermus profundus]
MQGMTDAMIEANKKLVSMGYRPVYCGITSLGCVLARVGEVSVLADHSFPVGGALVWFGVDQETGLALYYLQPLGHS